ncbi:MAG: adenylate/guanylate cyclase domain-containing protein [bacterium]|nr:adenylate/guanylate cyclase domain-containing protein [bacterium]
MQITRYLADLTVKAVADSIDIRPMTLLARDLMPNYDLHERLGLASNLPVPRSEAARQIIADVIEEGNFLTFISILIDIQYNGYRGNKFHISGLGDILWEIRELGLIFDKENHLFVEDPHVRRTRNWGALKEGEEYLFTFLRLDIVDSSRLVRAYPKNAVHKTYSDLQKIVRNAIDKRNGRVWLTDGDGLLIAFYFSNKHLLATLCAMEIIHELFFYNLFKNELGEPLMIRQVVHSGTCEYTNTEEELTKFDIIKQVNDIEKKYTEPGTATITGMVEIMLDPLLANQLKPIQTNTYSDIEYYRYQLNWES